MGLGFIGYIYRQDELCNSDMLLAKEIEVRLKKIQALRSRGKGIGREAKPTSKIPEVPAPEKLSEIPNVTEPKQSEIPDITEPKQSEIPDMDKPNEIPDIRLSEIPDILEPKQLTSEAVA